MDDAIRTDDAALAGRLADDLDGTFEVLVHAHAGRLFSIALRVIGDRSDAEEVAQDALVRAYRALAGYDPQTDPGDPAAAVVGDDRPEPLSQSDPCQAGAYRRARL